MIEPFPLTAVCSPSLFSRHILTSSDIICVNVMEHSPFISPCDPVLHHTHTERRGRTHTVTVPNTSNLTDAHSHSRPALHTDYNPAMTCRSKSPHSTFISFLWFLSGMNKYLKSYLFILCSITLQEKFFLRRDVPDGKRCRLTRLN